MSLVLVTIDLALPSFICQCGIYFKAPPPLYIFRLQLSPELIMSMLSLIRLPYITRMHSVQYQREFQDLHGRIHFLLLEALRRIIPCSENHFKIFRPNGDTFVQEVF